MQSCAFCGGPIFGSRCVNMHCDKSRKPKVSPPAAPTRKNTQKRPVSKKLKGPPPQDDGSYLIPTNIHLELEDSLPTYFGYKTDKKSTEDDRSTTLLLLYESTLIVHPGVQNRRAIAEFGLPSSSQRKNKLLSWMDGRIAKSKSPRLKASREKLVADRTFMVDNFQ